MHYFVSGTDTGVGKTVVATLLSLKLKRRYWKPIQSGVSEMTDTQIAESILGCDRVLREEFLLTEPLSPHLAALRDGVCVDLNQIMSRLSRVKDPLVIEGAGGLLVPLNQEKFLIDLIEEIGGSVILVSRTTLGTINHTLLSLEALKRRHIKIEGVILNGVPNLDNLRAIEDFGKTKVLAQIPWLPEVTEKEIRKMADRLVWRDLEH